MTQPSVTHGTLLPKRRRRRRSAAANATLWLMALPGLAVLLVFEYIPMLGSVIAFQDFRGRDGIFGSEWIGLKNFEFLFTSNSAWRITRNTVLLNVLFIVATLVVALTLAILLNEIRDRWAWLSKVYQSVLFLPHFFSWVVVSYFALTFLDPRSGLLNSALGAVGLDGPNWYTQPQHWPLILTITTVWKGVGFWVIVYSAGILAISPEYFEAAALDRASKWQQIRHITIPMLSPLIVLNLLLSIGGIFRADFGLFYLVTNNSPLLYPTTDVIDTFVFRSLTELGNLGMASAAGFYQSIVGFLLVVLANWLVRRVEPSQALF